MEKFISTDGKLISVPVFPIKDKEEEVYCVLQVTDPLLRNNGGQLMGVKAHKILLGADRATLQALSRTCAFLQDFDFEIKFEIKKAL
jgi:hypothetical protein